MKTNKLKLGDYNYDQQMIAYYKYASKMSNNQNKSIMLRKILLLAIVTILCLIALFSSLSLFVMYNTSTDIPLTESDLSFIKECKITLTLSMLFLLFIWIGYQLDNAVEIQE